MASDAALGWTTSDRREAIMTTEKPHPEQQYLDLLRDILDNGVAKGDRTGTGTTSVFGRQLRFDLSVSFPLLTTKKIPLRLIVHELLWFLRGDTNVRALQDDNVHIWDQWADEYGDLGPVYGAQWRRWLACEGDIDQIVEAERLIREDPNSRRIVVSSWNVADLPLMALSPCHAIFQIYVANGRLSLHLYQRSADLFLGVPFNIASYALLTMMFAKSAGLEPGEFIHTFGDVHIYSNHMDQVREQLTRKPRGLPQVVLTGDRASVLDYVFEDVNLLAYDPLSSIKAPVAV